MTMEEKMALVEELLDVERGSLREDTVLDDVDEDTSMAKLGRIVLMDDEFDVQLTGDRIRSFRTVGDILAAMEG